MSEAIEIPEEDLPVQDELTTLKARADLMGISYHPSIGVDKLREKIQAHLDGEEAKQPEEPKVEETKGKSRQDRRREAAELVRVNIACMNPLKKEWEGEIITAGNSEVGTFKKYVAFNTEEGYHIPRIILKQLQSRQCQTFYAAKDERGNRIRKSKLIKEFNIEILPPLTPEELAELARRQSMSKSA